MEPFPMDDESIDDSYRFAYNRLFYDVFGGRFAQDAIPS